MVNGWKAARKAGVSPLQALLSFIGAKLTNSSKSRATLSDLVFSFVGMYVAVLALGIMNTYAKTWPVVGHWHQQVGAGSRGRGQVEGRLRYRSYVLVLSGGECAKAGWKTP